MEENNKDKEKDNKFNKGLMYFDGPWKSKTYSGLDIDICKSGVQKYIRRGIVSKALMCAFELYRMEEVGGRSLQTNLYNRLAVIVAEDVGIPNLPLITSVLSILLTQDREEIDNFSSSPINTTDS